MGAGTGVQTGAGMGGEEFFFSFLVPGANGWLGIVHDVMYKNRKSLCILSFFCKELSQKSMKWGAAVLSGPTIQETAGPNDRQGHT